MKPEIQLLLDKQKAGENLGIEGIRTLMLYALEILKEFEQLTQASIARLNLTQARIVRPNQQILVDNTPQILYNIRIA